MTVLWSFTQRPPDAAIPVLVQVPEQRLGCRIPAACAAARSGRGGCRSALQHRLCEGFQLQRLLSVQAALVSRMSRLTHLCPLVHGCKRVGSQHGGSAVREV